jgi:hypothetical protein
MAERIVDHFGQATLDVIERAPARLVEVPGLGPKRTQMITAAWAEQQAIKEVMVFLQGVGVSTSLGVRLYKTYRDDAIELVRREPYRLAAPTGRAAKRLGELAGLEAATLHRLLQLRPGGDAAFDRDHPLDADLVVVDEASMLDVLLANSSSRPSHGSDRIRQDLLPGSTVSERCAPAGPCPPARWVGWSLATGPRAVRPCEAPEDAPARGDRHRARLGDRQGPPLHVLAQARRRPSVHPADLRLALSGLPQLRAAVPQPRRPAVPGAWHRAVGGGAGSAVAGQGNDEGRYGPAASVP